MSPDVVSVTLRAAVFVSLFQATGIAFFLAIFSDRLTHSGSSIRRLGLVAASVGVGLVLGHQSVEAARMADDFSGAFDADLQKLALFSSGGVEHLTQALGLMLLALAYWRPARFGAAVGLAGAALAIAAFAFTGHTSVHPLRWLLAPLLTTHMLIVTFWFGALAPLFIATRHETLTDSASIMEKFSAIAGWLVPGILIAGLIMAVILAPDWSVLRRPYGALLTVKVLGFALLMGLAALNKWRWTPALVAGESRARASLRRSIAAEYLLIVTVLSVTATLTALYSPEH